MDTDQNKIELDWKSATSRLLLNPKLPMEERNQLRSLFDRYQSDLSGHLWVGSSGSSSSEEASVKLVALSKTGFLHSAQAVNQHLQSKKSDIWGLALPSFHVGGLAILARGFLSGAKVVDFFSPEPSRTEQASMPVPMPVPMPIQWSAENYFHFLKEHRVTLSALVPTQVFDLVQANLGAPSHLRAVIVGGASLQTELYRQARVLGWPLLPSFGMTEVCSQIATADLGSLSSLEFPALRILPHVQCRITVSGQLEIRSPALLSGYAQILKNKFHFCDPKQDSWYLSEDRAQLIDDTLQPLGRESEYVKVLGEGVNISIVEAQFRNFCRKQTNRQELELYVGTSADFRRGVLLNVYALQDPTLAKKLQLLLIEFNKENIPVHRLDQIRWVDKFPKTALGKIQRNLLK